MKISKRTILMLGVISGLVLFSSGFCTQASVEGQGMPGMAMGADAHTISLENMIAQDLDVTVVSQDNASHAVDSCIFECATKTPPVTLSEKTKISSHAANLLSLYFSSVDPSVEGPLVRRVASGESPGDISSADILLSVQKRE